MTKRKFTFQSVPELEGMSFAEEEALAEQLAADRCQEIKPHVGLKKLRSSAKYSQVKMAKTMGVSRKSYQLYESGSLPVPSDKLARIVAYFDADIRELFYGKPFTADRSVKMESAEIGIAAFISLLAEHDDEFGTKLEMDEMKRVAMVYVRQHEPGEQLDKQDLWHCVQVVTGGKYLPAIYGDDDPTTLAND